MLKGGLLYFDRSSGQASDECFFFPFRPLSCVCVVSGSTGAVVRPLQVSRREPRRPHMIPQQVREASVDASKTTRNFGRNEAWRRSGWLAGANEGDGTDQAPINFVRVFHIRDFGIRGPFAFWVFALCAQCHTADFSKTDLIITFTVYPSFWQPSHFALRSV
jgi:hypothetical protein